MSGFMSSGTSGRAEGTEASPAADPAASRAANPGASGSASPAAGRAANPAAGSEAVPDFPSKDSNENDILIPFLVTAVQEAANTGGRGYEVKDTHRLSYLSGCAPDITVTEHGYPAHAFNAVFLIEVQEGGLDDHHRGKAIKYCELLLSENRERASAMCLLTNLHEVQIFVMQRMQENQRSSSVVESNPVSMSDSGWRCICDMLTCTPMSLGYKAPVFTFGGLEYRATGNLGSGSDTQVYAVQRDGETMVCKVYSNPQALSRAFKRELAVLEAIAADPSPCPALPKLLASDATFPGMLLTQPVVELLDTISVSDVSSFLDALAHLHLQLQWVYRDVEPKHLGISSNQQPSFIDFGSAAPLHSTAPSAWSSAEDALSAQQLPETCLYAGTLIFASDDVLTALGSGQYCAPHPRQDLVALIKSVYVLIHASAAKDVGALARTVAQQVAREDVHAAVQAIRGFWDEEWPSTSPAGQMWRAMALDVQGLHPDDKDQYLAGIGRLREALSGQVRGRVR